METKDWLTIIVLAATIISSHLLVSIQIRKNTRAKWIEDFRSEISKFIALANLVSPKNLQTVYNLSECSFVILMLLDDRKSKHRMLNDEIAEFGLFSVQYTSAKLDEHNSRMEKIKDLAKAIIRQEQKWL